MPSDKAIQCSVITPERQVLDAKAVGVVIPSHDGLLGVLNLRAPLVCQLGIGPLRVDLAEGGSKSFFVDGGFAQVLDNRVAILTQSAVAAEEIDRPATEKALKAAEAMPIKDDASFEARQQAIARAQAKLKLAK